MAEVVPGRKQERTIEEIRAQIEEEFNKEGLHRILQKLTSDQHRRIIRKNHPAVLTWEPDPIPTGEYYIKAKKLVQMLNRVRRRRWAAA